MWWSDVAWATWAAKTCHPPSCHGDVPETEGLVQLQLLSKCQCVVNKEILGVELDATEHASRAILGIHSLEAAHIKGFLVHELDIEVAENQCQPVIGFE